MAFAVVGILVSTALLHHCTTTEPYCGYFAGMTFAVVGILGHNAKTVLLFFLPQIANFLYSCPQLFKLIPCPRHRMPGYDRPTDRLVVSWSEFDEAQLGTGGRLVLCACEVFQLAAVERPAPDGATAAAGDMAGDAAGGSAARARPVRLSNLTIINLALHLLGPMHEARLATTLLALQVGASTRRTRYAPVPAPARHAHPRAARHVPD